VRLGAGLEAASIEEVELALAAGCQPDHVVFDSPAKTVEEINQALGMGVYLNADNFDELHRIAAALPLLNTSSKVGLRINAMVGGGTIQHTSVSVSGSKFGVPIVTDQRRIIDAFAEHEWLSGLHVHVGSQGCGLALLTEAVGRVAALRQAVAKETGRHIPQVDIGGGLPTVYRTGDVAPTLTEYRSVLQKVAPELFTDEVRLITEFGRAIHANCGIAISRVEYVKAPQQLAVIHLGADFLLRPVYRPEDWHHEFFVLDQHGRTKKGPESMVTITGPLCFAGDIVARKVLLPLVEEGDWIVIRDVGAYTLSMWSRHCSRSIPAVIGYNPQQLEKLQVLRRAERPRDIVRYWDEQL
jgi:diaminopimelate decarboxylase